MIPRASKISKDHIIATLFIFTVVASFIFHLGYRDRHFQECDSTLVYHTFRDALQNKLQTLIPDYNRPEQTPTKFLTGLIFSQKPLAGILLAQSGGLSLDAVANRFNQKSPVGALRAIVRNTVFFLVPGTVLQLGLALPFFTTYSFGSGIVYAFVMQFDSSVDEFMSSGIILTQILFHICPVLIFLICRKMGLKSEAAAAGGLLMLFSISLYSYGYHLGSTVWNYSTELIWLYVLAVTLGKPTALRRVSWVTGIIAFFNYLVVFYWVGFLLAYLYLETAGNRSTRMLWIKARMILRTQISAITLVFFAIAFFYPPGQGNRAPTSLQTLLPDLYYIVLNFFSFYNTSTIFDLLQFMIGLTLTTLGVYCFLLPDGNRGSSVEGVMKKTLFAVLCLFTLAALLGILSFSPARHVLFLAPVIFIGSTLAIDQFFGAGHQRWAYSLLTALVLIGFFSLSVRRGVVEEKFAETLRDPGASELLIFDCSYDLYYRQLDSGTPVAWIDPKKLIVGRTYLYMSQTTPFLEAINFFEKEMHYVIDAEPTQSFEEGSGVYFTAYNPRGYLFTRPNGYFVTEFKLRTGVSANMEL